MQTSSYAISRWRVLFIAEGVPTVALGVFIIFFLPSRPETSCVRLETILTYTADAMADAGSTICRKMLNDAERALAIERQHRTQKVEAVGTVDKKQLLAGALDYRSWLGAIIYLGLNVIIGSVSSFLPCTCWRRFLLTAFANPTCIQPSSRVSAVRICSDERSSPTSAHSLPMYRRGCGRSAVHGPAVFGRIRSPSCRQLLHGQVCAPRHPRHLLHPLQLHGLCVRRARAACSPVGIADTHATQTSFSHMSSTTCGHDVRCC